MKIKENYIEHLLGSRQCIILEGYLKAKLYSQVAQHPVGEKDNQTDYCPTLEN